MPLAGCSGSCDRPTHPKSNGGCGTQAGAHLYAYGEPTWPRCGDLINRATTRAATSGDPLCRACLDWYAFEVDLLAHA